MFWKYRQDVYNAEQKSTKRHWWNRLDREVSHNSNDRCSMKTIWMLALVTLLPVLILDACRASESTSGGSASVSAVVTNENVGEMLVKMEQEWADANVRGDLEFQDRILADDYIGTMEDGSTNTKAQWIDFLRSGTVRLESVDVTGIKVRMFDNVAV